MRAFSDGASSEEEGGSADRAAHGQHRGRFARRRSPAALPQLRAERHYLACAPGRPRRPQTRPAAHPLYDVQRAPASERRQAPEVGRDRRRRDGQVPPARGHRHLRRPRTDGAVLHDARASGRRSRQLRLAGRRFGGGHALHGGEASEAFRRAPGRAREEDGRLPTQLRRTAVRAGSAARALSQPVGEWLAGHCSWDGNLDSASQFERGDSGVRRAHRRGSHHQAAHEARQRSRLPDRRRAD